VSAAAGAACSSVIVSIMGSFQRHQERLARMREQMKVRKTVDIGKEVLTGKLRQKRLYDFMDEPAIEEKIDNILSLLVRKEKQLMAAETQLRRVQDSVSILTFFRALSAVRDLEKAARGKLITEMKDVSKRLKAYLVEGDEKRQQINFFVQRLDAANKRIEELKTKYAENAAHNEVTAGVALDLCALEAVQQGYTQRELDDIKREYRREIGEHIETKRVLADTAEALATLRGKFAALMDHHVTVAATNEGEASSYLTVLAITSSEAQRVTALYKDLTRRYERNRQLFDSQQMTQEDEDSHVFVEGNKRGKSRASSRASSKKSSKKGSKSSKSRSKSKGRSKSKSKKGGGAKSAGKKPRGGGKKGKKKK